MNNKLLVANNITKIFSQVNGDNLVIFEDLNFTVDMGQSISIVGSSGSGKSTLLHILAGLDSVTSGNILYQNRLISELKDEELAKIRNEDFGFIYQFHHLLPEFSVAENILMPLYIKHNNKVLHNNEEKLDYILNALGIFNKKYNYISTLSGGQRQRVAIARAIFNYPKIIFADEPTGNLDNDTSQEVFDVFFNLQKEFAISLIMVTHNINLANKTDLKYELHSKKLLRLT
jgi:lipoprotein-releasing system ATP-binding protein